MEGTLIIYIGLDYIKGALLTDDKSQKITIEKPLDIFLKDEYVEQDPEQWFDAVVEIIKEVQEKDRETVIESMTVTYQPGTFVCVDRSGNHLMNAMLSCDRRAKYQAQVCYKSFKKHNTLPFVPWDYMILPRLQWIKYNKPDIYKRIFKVLTPDGYIAYKLCGETGIDNYSAVFLGYNPKTNQYNNKIIDSLELDINTFPRVCKVGECIGMVSGTTKERLNLESDTKFLMSTNSIIPVCLTGFSIEENSIIFDAESANINFISYHTKTKRINNLIRLPYKEDKFICSYMGNYELNFLKWIEQFAPEEPVEEGNYIIGSNGLLVMPYLMGDGTFYNTDMRASIIGINSSNVSNIITACYESIGYVLKDRIDYITDGGINVESIEVLSSIKNQLFYKILSNITSKKIIINNERDSIIECINSIIAGETVTNDINKQEIIPDENLHGKYQQFLNLYKSAYNLLGDVYKYRRKILKRLQYDE